MRKTTTRRSVLQGLGVALALPHLDLFAEENAVSATPPRRLVCLGNHLGFYAGDVFPRQAGKDYEMSPTLKGLVQHRDDFTVFSHLDHGLSGGHAAVHAFLSGVRKEEAAGFDSKNITIDQRAAEVSGAATRYRSITTGIKEGTLISWTRSGVAIPPVNNPARLFEALFVQGDPAHRESERRRLTQRTSVLDALSGSAGAFSARLGQEDKDKLDQYLTSVREVERSIQMSEEWLDKPKPEALIDPIANEERENIETTPLLLHLLALALQTDSTRVGTFEIPLGFQTNELEVGSYHGLSHHGKEAGRLKELTIVDRYFFKQFGTFMDRLKEGGVFDHTAVVIGSGMGNASSHSNRDLPVVLAGGGFGHQGHLVLPKEEHKRVPLSNLFLSLLQWFGAEDENFGRSTGTFSPMEIG